MGPVRTGPKRDTRNKEGRAAPDEAPGAYRLLLEPFARILPYPLSSNGDTGGASTRHWVFCCEALGVLRVLFHQFCSKNETIVEE